jgi:hypothetical protein
MPQVLATPTPHPPTPRRRNSLSGTLPALLGPAWAGSLKSLDLSGNRLAGTVPADWGRMARLQELELGGNPGLRGCLPPGLAALGSAGLKCP